MSSLSSSGLSDGTANQGGTVRRLRFQISMSLDGFVAGPNQSVENPLGEGGMQLHEWVFGLAAWRKQEPTEQPYGVDAGFRDTSGNQIRMVQTK